MLVLILVLVVYNTHTIHVIPTLFYTSPRSLSLLIDGEDAVELLMAADPVSYTHLTLPTN